MKAGKIREKGVKDEALRNASISFIIYAEYHDTTKWDLPTFSSKVHNDLTNFLIGYTSKTSQSSCSLHKLICEFLMNFSTLH